MASGGPAQADRASGAPAGICGEAHDPALTQRELEVIRLVAQGQSNRRDRRNAGHQREDRQGAREQHPRQTWFGGSHQDGNLRHQEWPGKSRQMMLTEKTRPRSRFATRRDCRRSDISALRRGGHPHSDQSKCSLAPAHLFGVGSTLFNPITLMLWHPIRKPLWQHLYFVFQALLVFALVLLRPRFDFIVILYVILSLHAVLILSNRARWIWVAVLTLSWVFR